MMKYFFKATSIPCKATFITSLILVPIGAAADSNWPQFRGESASGVAAGSPPVEWDGESGKNILWKAEIPGLGHSSPIIWGDRIFVTSAVPETGESTLKVGLYGDIKPVEGEGPQKFNLYCLDRKTGKLLWERTALTGQPKIKRHPKSTEGRRRHPGPDAGTAGWFDCDHERPRPEPTDLRDSNGRLW